MPAAWGHATVLARYYTLDPLDGPGTQGGRGWVRRMGAGYQSLILDVRFQKIPQSLQLDGVAPLIKDPPPANSTTVRWRLVSQHRKGLVKALNFLHSEVPFSENSALIFRIKK